MWTETRVTGLLGIRCPILQAPMAGGATTPELVAAVSNAGGLGALGAGYMSAAAMRGAIRRIRELTDRPFAVNLFVPETPQEDEERMAAAHRLLRPYRQELGLSGEPQLSAYAEPFAEQIAVVLAERVTVFSFTFGIPSEEILQQLREQGIKTIGTATTVREAVLLEQSGIDLIHAQGGEAGGHRGTFLGRHGDALVGTMALVPQIVDHVTLPVIAAGGIMDGRGIAASLMLGAEAVQLGTAFLTTAESGIHPDYQAALLSSTEESTALTSAFSGKPARGLQNRFLREMEPHQQELPDYPIQNALTRDIRQAAAGQNNTDFMSLWAGQGTRLTRRQTAAELMANLIEETHNALHKVKRIP
ncbi:nitronate monooxygenase [Tumebacillus avium]|uniref:Probable nitronate monooxygenase n=1 Tax=Tumebacillus avium TaxID=1903704 RepID=A0A1Y0II79_9BACL|nr:nitronate monooxygenase [Tumebacillus avium]ARU60157.1 nitronate monooxygenase [Tumebacillus avium]